MCYVLIGSILRFKHALTVYYPSSSIFNYQAIGNNYFCKLFSNYTWIALNYTSGSINFGSKDIFHFTAFTRLTILESNFEIKFSWNFTLNVSFGTISVSINYFKRPLSKRQRLASIDWSNLL